MFKIFKMKVLDSVIEEKIRDNGEILYFVKRYIKRYLRKPRFEYVDRGKTRLEI